MANRRYVGKRIVRDDALEKATGKLKYFGDYAIEGMLYGKILRAEYPHARIRGIDISQAEARKDVVTVLTYKDVPGLNGFGIAGIDQPVLCQDKVRFYGDVVAVAIAKTEEEAKEALGYIHVDYEPLQVLNTVEAAMAPDAEKIHESGNIYTSFDFTNGDVAEVFERDDVVVVEHTYTTPYQEHAYLETEVGLAKPGDDGGVEIFCPAQYGYRDRAQLSKVLNLPQEKIIIHSSPLGGGFGGKDDMSLQPLLAVGVLKTGKPLKISVDREESFRFSTKRIPFKIQMKTAADRNGKLAAQKVKAVGDMGPFTGISGAVFNYALENACGAYFFPRIDIKGDCVFTNNAHTGAFRGFGNNQLNFAVETQMDELAEKLGADRLEFRKKNIIHSGERLSYGHLHGGADGLEKSLDLLEKSELWKNREAFKKGAKEPWLKRGVGIASSQHGNGLGNALPDEGSARIELDQDGFFTLFVGTEEMGQGTITALHQIAADALQVDMEYIRIVNANTSIVPDTGSTTASKATYVAGKATVLAAEKFLRQTKQFFKDEKKMDVEIALNGVRIGGKVLPWVEVYKELSSEMKKAEDKFVVPTTDVKIAVGLHFVHTHVSQVVGVEVNTITGQVQVLETEILPAAGTVVNAIGYEGQAEGGVVMTMGFTLMEEYRIDQNTHPLTKNFQTYLVPTIQDIPEIKVTPVEVEEESGPFGAKGLGEPVTIPGAPAITNAIYDAVGVRVYSLPVKPEKLLEQMNS